MPRIPPEGMSQVIPYLYCTDVPKTAEWLGRAFGFETIMIEPTGNGRHHGEMRFGAGMARDLDGHDWFFTRPPG
ncbi:MAG: hypothetical protein ACREFD_10855 [Stellaceae bacterium]